MKAGWERKRLVDLGKLQTGTTPSTKEKTNYGSYIPFVKPSHFNEDGSLNTNEIGLSKTGLNKGRLIPKNSILMVCIGATIGKTGYSTIPVSCNQQINTFTPKEGLSTKYFYYALSSEGFRNKVMVEASQATLPIINKSKWGALEVTYPKSLSEQQQIVALLDQAFAAIDQAKANLERNLLHAKELFQSKLNEIFSQQGEGWEERKLGEVCSIISKLVDPREEKLLDLLHIGGGNIVSETGELQELKTSKEENLKSGKFLFDEKMVLYNKIRPYLIKVCRPSFSGLCSADMYPLTPDENRIQKDYLYFLLISKRFTDYAIQGSARAGMPKVNRKHLFEFNCFIPSIDSQKRATNEMNDLKDYIQTLQVEYKKKLLILDDLKKSLLQKAFAGELTSEAMAT